MMLSDLSDTCDTCDVRATFTGRTEVREGRATAILRCPSCHADIPVWSRDTDALVRAWAADPLPESAMFPLRGGNAEQVAAYLAHPPARVPAWRLNDVAVTIGSAEAWCELVLAHPGLVPRPTPADRLEEALAAAIRFDDPDCARLATDRLAAFTGADVEAALLKLPARIGGESGAALRPFIAALRASGGDYATALATVERRWALPGLREALE